ncbi:MAG: hypothetical protein JNN07_01680 [Verrucomicrobiales bacterium]|nr:hypothetical protein [Verrucomicrobiales bacterium]
MDFISLKALHHYLRLLENPAELKRKMPASANQRNLKDSLGEISKLAGLEASAFKNPELIGTLIGDARFVRIWGEPSLTDRVSRVFDGTRLLLSLLIDPSRYDQPSSGQLGATAGGAPSSLQPKTPAPSWIAAKAEIVANEQDTPLESLKPILAGNLELTCRLFRALFEHMLSSAAPPSGQQGTSLLVHDLAGTKENGRTFLPTALFLLGSAIAEKAVVPFMMELGLFGVPMLEHLLQNRDYCEAHYSFRRLERAISGSAAEEELLIRNRMNRLLAQNGAQASTLFTLNSSELEKAQADAHLAAADLLEALALTPYALCLRNAIHANPANCVLSVKAIALHFISWAERTKTKDQANQEIADHLLAFARQFSTHERPEPADPVPTPLAS